MASVKGIGKLNKLRLLCLHDSAVKDLGPLHELHALENLDVAGHKPLTWDFLKTLTSLHVLDLGMSSFKDLKVLSSLTKLELVRLPKAHFKRNDLAMLALAKQLVSRGDGCGVSLSDSSAWQIQLIDPSHPRRLLPLL